MKYTNVIFDFDGTIADTLPHILRISHRLFPQYSQPYSDKEVEELRNLSILQLTKKFNIPFYKIPFIINQFRTELQHSIAKVEIFPGMDSLIHEIKTKEINIGILSSNTIESIQKNLTHHKLNIFNFIYSELNIFGKDKSLTNLIKYHNLIKSKTIYIGDEVRDVEACRKIQMDCIAVTWGFNTKNLLSQAKPLFIVDQPSNILEIILN